MTDEVRERGIRRLIAAAQVPCDLPFQPTLVFLLRLLDQARSAVAERDRQIEELKARRPTP